MAMDNMKDISLAQRVHTLIVACTDCPVEPLQLLSCQPDEVLVIRNIGNFIPPWHPRSLYSENATITFALSHFDIRHIIVCGHSQCGAMTDCSRYDDEALPPPLDHWIGLIHSQIAFHSTMTVDDIARKNVLNQLINIQKHPLIQKKRQAHTLTLDAWFLQTDSHDLLIWDKQLKSYQPSKHLCPEEV